MKKLGVLVILFLFLFSVAPVLAAVGDTCQSLSDCETGQICTNDECVLDTSEDPESPATNPEDDSEKIENGFKCLEEEAGDCSSLSTEEIALTILATPDNIFDSCVSELESKKESDNSWGNVKDTAMAIVALEHAGKDIADSVTWLMSQSQTPTDLIWYFEQDSNEESACNINYDANAYDIIVGENKKIDKNAGLCLTRAESNFWLEVSPDCFEKDLMISCDKDFIATLLYKNKLSSTFYVLEGTDEALAYESITLSVNSKCFGSGSCDYESTLWATYALLKTKHNFEEYIPYIIAMSDTNERYLPEAFVYILTNYPDYANQLVASQKLGDYWEATRTANNRYYDTSLALIALGSSTTPQTTKAKKWLLHNQGQSNGCWQTVKDTAMVLWALTGKPGRSSGGGTIVRCFDAGYFCIPRNECLPTSDDVGNNYHCRSDSETCCMSENLKTCSEYGGEQCSDDELCDGVERESTDISECCTGTCKDRLTQTECEDESYTCMNSCPDGRETPNYDCDGAQVCCGAEEDDDEEGGSLMWVWILIILILIVAGAIGWVKREELKLFLFKLQTKFKKDKGKGGPLPFGRPGPRGPPPRRPGPRGPPRPGFPPIRRQPASVAPVKKERPAPTHPRRNGNDRRGNTMSETFKKLQDMSS